ncbi:MAG: galactokinase [Limnochordales bacterium]|nr:galactokinase [Limnochordales bacterium]
MSQAETNPPVRHERLTCLYEEFHRRFGDAPAADFPIRAVRAPGRVNLIGEHTDYNGGFVLPAAIDREVIMVGRRRPDHEVRLYSLDYQEEAAGDVRTPDRTAHPTWSRYVHGVVWALQQRGFKPGGFEAVLTGNVPQGAGLSSSAALEVATAMLLQTLFDLPLSGPEMAALCQEAENRFVGVNCGIMDQFISRMGRQGTALLLDCRSLEYRWVPLPDERVRIVIANTAVVRGLVASAYNVRRAECEEGVRLIRQWEPTVSQLRDVTPEMLEKYASHLPEPVRRRVTHVVAENQRVLETVAALEEGDWQRCGELLVASHASLRDLYEVSSPALDLMVELALSVPGVLGSRMTGAGFGGCTVSLVREEAVEQFLATVIPEYRRRATWQLAGEPEAYVCRAADGATVIS